MSGQLNISTKLELTTKFNKIIYLVIAPQIHNETYLVLIHVPMGGGRGRRGFERFFLTPPCYPSLQFANSFPEFYEGVAPKFGRANYKILEIV